MDFFSQLFKAFSSLFTRAKDAVGAADIKHRDWSSLRWLGLLAIVGLVVYNATTHLLADTSLTLVAHCYIVWLICNTVTRSITTAANAWSRVRISEIVDRDGIITEGEQRIVDGAPADK